MASETIKPCGHHPDSGCTCRPPDPALPAPIQQMMDLLGSVPLESWAIHSRANPSRTGTCIVCEQAIVETPWFSERTGTFHVAGWIHVDTELSPCGSAWPYRFAEPLESIQ